MINYSKLSDNEKKKIIKQAYEVENKSFKDIASEYGTYANKIRRDAMKLKIKIKNKSEAQANALKSGKAKHPTMGKSRPKDVKNRIGHAVMKSWESLDEATLKQRKNKAKENWDKMDEHVKEQILQRANSAVREASKKGSKLELYLLDKLLKDGYKVDFHKEQTLSNTKLQIDLFLPTLNIAIEVDGLSHFEPVWGSETLKRNKKYDNKKTGLILGKGLVLIRIKQLKDFSKARADVIYKDLLNNIQNIQQVFPASDYRNIIIGDN
jgi:very-short-patch-repair endonuclease